MMRAENSLCGLRLRTNRFRLNFKGTEYTKEKSDISGAERIAYGTKPLNITIPRYDEAKVSASVAPPLYYIVPPQWQKVIEILQAHGIKFQRIEKPLTIEVESYRLTDAEICADVV